MHIDKVNNYATFDPTTSAPFLCKVRGHAIIITCVGGESGDEAA